jgi:hypothetical protein
MVAGYGHSLIDHVLIRAPSGPRPSNAQISDNFKKYILSSAIEGDEGGGRGEGGGVWGGGFT